MGGIRFTWARFKTSICGMGRIDLACAIALYLLSAYKQYRPESALNMDLLVWQLPLAALGLIVVCRFIFVAPYYLWKAEKDKQSLLQQEIDNLRQIDEDKNKQKQLSDLLLENALETKKQLENQKKQAARDKIRRIASGYPD